MTYHWNILICTPLSIFLGLFWFVPSPFKISGSASAKRHIIKSTMKYSNWFLWIVKQNIWSIVLISSNEILGMNHLDYFIKYIYKASFIFYFILYFTKSNHWVSCILNVSGILTCLRFSIPSWGSLAIKISIRFKHVFWTSLSFSHL